MPAEKIAALKDGADSPVFDDLEKLVLRFTDEVVRNVKASDETFRALNAHLSNREMAELVGSEEHTSALQSITSNSYADFCLNKKNLSHNKLLTLRHDHP